MNEEPRWHLWFAPWTSRRQQDKAGRRGWLP